MASLQAILYRVDRTAERLIVDRPSTLRGPDGKPIDVTIDDLSTDGCRLTLPASANIGEGVMIGLAGVGIRGARVIWSDAGVIGCQFEKPLTSAELQQAQFAQTVEEGRFPALPVLPEHIARDAVAEPGYPPAVRLALIAGLATASWALVGGVATIGYLLLAG